MSGHAAAASFFLGHPAVLLQPSGKQRPWPIQSQPHRVLRQRGRTQEQAFADHLVHHFLRRLDIAKVTRATKVVPNLQGTRAHVVLEAVQKLGPHAARRAPWLRLSGGRCSSLNSRHKQTSATTASCYY